ncbi:MAG: hypothetical protein Q4G52_05475 [Clostridia bacterium]|nr:hypothetical protein [Clostridia bacterium]
MRQKPCSPTEDPHRYDDMIPLPHPVSQKHPQMSRCNRAAQFSPFAALAGYDAELAEAGRTTDRRIELSESEKACLDARLRIIQKWLNQRPGKWDAPGASPTPPTPPISMTHFVKDPRKDGGTYITTQGAVRRIDRYAHAVVMDNGQSIPIETIIAIESKAFPSE